MARLQKLKGVKIAVLEMRSHGAWYVKGMRGASHYKREMSQAKSTQEIIELVEHYREYLKKGPE